jgi:L-ascorbate metabolism protein UlaG (beta-lactamase superfamily)
LKADNNLRFVIICSFCKTEFDKVDLIVVSHNPLDHFSDTEAIARRTGAPVI